MAAKRSRHIALTAPIAPWVEKIIAQGGYASIGDLVRTALRRLEDDHRNGRVGRPVSSLGVIGHAYAEQVQLALAAGAIIGIWFWDIPADRLTIDEPFAKAFGLDATLGREVFRWPISLLRLIPTIATAWPRRSTKWSREVDAMLTRIV